MQPRTGLVCCMISLSLVVRGAEAQDVGYTYDRIRDVGSIRTDTMAVGKNVAISIGAFFKGPTPTAVPDSLVLDFVTTWATWRFLDDRQVILLLDDTARVSLCNPSHSGTVARGYVVEDLSCEIPTEIARRIAAATKVEGGVGTIDFALQPYERETIKQLLARLAGAPRSDTANQAYLAFEVDAPADIDVMHEVTPRYPSALRKAKAQGTVVAQFIVQADGTVDATSIRILSAENEAFVAPTLEVLPRARFAPATKAGAPVRQWMRQVFVFYPDMGG